MNLTNGEVTKAEDAKATNSEEEKAYFSGGSYQPVSQTSIEQDKRARSEAKIQKAQLNGQIVDEEMDSDQEDEEEDEEADDDE